MIADCQDVCCHQADRAQSVHGDLDPMKPYCSGFDVVAISAGVTISKHPEGM